MTPPSAAPTDPRAPATAARFRESVAGLAEDELAALLAFALALRRRLRAAASTTAGPADQSTPRQACTGALPMIAPSAHDHLRAYIAQVQDTACSLAALLEAVAILKDDPAGDNALTAVLSIAQEKADQVYVSLDSVNLPRPPT